jgi:hypothetical protein
MMIGGTSFLKMLQEFLKDNVPLNIHALGYFQQDGVPSHFSLVVQN